MSNFSVLTFCRSLRETPFSLCDMVHDHLRDISWPTQWEALAAEQIFIDLAYDEQRAESGYFGQSRTTYCHAPQSRYYKALREFIGMLADERVEDFLYEAVGAYMERYVEGCEPYDEAEEDTDGDEEFFDDFEEFERWEKHSQHIAELEDEARAWLAAGNDLEDEYPF